MFCILQILNAINHFSINFQITILYISLFSRPGLFARDVNTVNALNTLSCFHVTDQALNSGVELLASRKGQRINNNKKKTT